MSIHEIVLPETKPETEWILGRAVQKVSPTYSHARLQWLLAAAMGDWADAGNFGRVGSEWRFRVAPPGEIVRPLVPDVAYLSYHSLARDVPPEVFEVPLGAPTVAVEILSPDDRKRNVRYKILTYLSAGTEAVFVIEPRDPSIVVHDADGRRRYAGEGTLTHASIPGFALDVGAYFQRARR